MRLFSLYALACGALIGYAPVAMAQHTLDLPGTTEGAPAGLLPLFGSTAGDCTLSDQPEPYQIHLLQVDTGAEYTVSVVEPISLEPDTDDTLLLLYEGALVPEDACGGLIAIGNEVPGEDLTVALAADQPYVLVVAGFFGSEDAYAVRISGPEGSIISSGDLPVELARFDARLDGGEVLLTWTTASETNNAGFGVEVQGASEAAWHERAFVSGRGTTAEATRYTHRLRALEPGAYRFRLRQVGFDGAFAYSPEAELAVTLVEPFRFAAPRPNPSGGSTRLVLAAREAQQVRVSAFDVAGREIAVLFDGLLPADAARALVFDTSAWPAGTYLLRATGERFTAMQRLTVVR